MVKTLAVDPEEVRKSKVIHLGQIPVNSFSQTFIQSLTQLGKDKVIFSFRTMLIIREFELMLEEIKKLGKYQETAFKYAGPAHLSIGQEASAVGQALALDTVDIILGSHRSHGETLAKGLFAIDKLSDQELTKIFEAPETKHIIKNFNSSKITKKEKAIEVFLFGLISEIFGKETGFNKGLGGSMHAFYTPFGIYPNNAIVGGSAPIATGIALYNRVQRKNNVVIANIGDASSACGPVWESMNFAAMGQFKTNKEKKINGGLPIVYFFVNNFYGMGGQPIGETMGYENLARVGAGINPDRLHTEVVDGNNIFAVHDAITRAKKIIAQGKGPVLIDCQTYRFSGHSPSDASSYRTKEEIDSWRDVDPIKILETDILNNNLLLPQEIEEMHLQVKKLTFDAFVKAIDDKISPRLPLHSNPEIIGNLTFNNTSKEIDFSYAAETLMDPLQTQRVKSTNNKSRIGKDQNGILSGVKAITFRDALFEPILEHAIHDDSLVIYGEENRDWGGAFGVYRGLTEVLPSHRLFNSPIAEAAIVGTAVGYAMAGGRALIELMYADFIGRAGDEIFNQLAKWQAMSGGILKLPVVLRISVGSKYGAQHSQDWSSLLTHISGLKVIYPATAFDAKGLMASALESNDPVVFVENQRLYDNVETINISGVPQEYYKIEIGKPAIVRAGKDLTIFSVGACLIRALEAAEVLENKWNISTEVIDARSLVPFDPDLLIKSVSKTKKLICISDACERGNWLHGIMNLIYEKNSNDLENKISSVMAPNWITPAAEQEWNYFPSVENILDAVLDQGITLLGRVRTIQNDSLNNFKKGI
ncbi:MAG: thiamine pyrophosphate-dependent enzyme [Actinomycetota bacterium]|nr:thiamine pyrophosphate-dependent enzyme [Actinomycetota bacterium]